MMPLQNRVAPDGSLHAVSERGTMLGNRGGRFHRGDQTLGPRHFSTPHWIACELHYKNMHHEPMGRGYTSLFFLDEVTALTAGHRPCFFCRRVDAVHFAGLFAPDANRPKVKEIDRALHAERRAARFEVRVADCPDGAMFEKDGAFLARLGRKLLVWSFAGYSDAAEISPAMRLKVLTPPTILAILARGYEPRWHSSAKLWGPS